jgi:hypothetical protein
MGKHFTKTPYPGFLRMVNQKLHSVHPPEPFTIGDESLRAVPSRSFSRNSLQWDPPDQAPQPFRFRYRPSKPDRLWLPCGRNNRIPTPSDPERFSHSSPGKRQALETPDHRDEMVKADFVNWKDSANPDNWIARRSRRTHPADRIFPLTKKALDSSRAFIVPK